MYSIRNENNINIFGGIAIRFMSKCNQNVFKIKINACINQHMYARINKQAIVNECKQFFSKTVSVQQSPDTVNVNQSFANNSLKAIASSTKFS